MAISASAKTQGRHALSGRRHGSFAGKSGSVLYASVRVDLPARPARVDLVSR